MSSNAIDAQGTILAIGDGATPTETFTTIPEITSIQGPGGSASEIDVTDLSSSAKEFRMGLQDEGQITLEMNWIPTNTQHKQLMTDRANQTLRNFKLTYNDYPSGTDTTKTFSAFVMSITESQGVDAVLKASVTLRVSGAITQTDGA